MTKRLIICLLLLFICTTVNAEVTVDGYRIDYFQLLGYEGLTSAPAVSSSSQAIMYYNSSDDKLYLSKNGGAYSEVGAGSGSGDNVTVNGTAVDTTANFKDNTEITFTLTDGGAGGPDDVKGVVGVVAGSKIELDELNTATYDDVQDFVNLTQSSGWLTGGAFTDNGNGTLAVAAGTGFIKATNSATATTCFFDWDTDASVTLSDEDTNYIYVEYNSGTPQVASSTTRPTDNRTNVLLGKVYREGTSLNLYRAGLVAAENSSKTLFRVVAQHGEVARTSGLIIGETGTRNVTSTAGILWGGLTSTSISAINTSGADTFEYYYYDGDLATPAWVESDESQIDNLQYNDVNTGLETLTSNRYGVHWVYMDFGGSMLVVYGQGDYTLANAQSSQPPSSLPDHVSEFSVLIGRIIIKKSDSTFTEIASAFDKVFTATASTDHGELAGLTDDDHTQYILHNGTRAMTANWDIGNFDITLKSLTGDGTIEGATLTESGNAVYNSTEVPGGELGGTWESPTIDDGITVTSWELGASTATTPASNDNDTSLATTAWCETTQNYALNSELHAQSHAMTSTSDHTATAWRVFYSNADGDVTELALGTDGQVLTSTGASTAPAFEDATGGGLSNVVEDLTPQLGGDLDLNSKNIDFPTTVNISDCLDEDDMASDSATALCTQQSIKKYVDDNAGGGSSTTGYQETLTIDSNGDTSLTLANSPVSNASVVLYINGQQQEQGAGKDYSISGTAITWLDRNFTLKTTDLAIAHYNSATGALSQTDIDTISELNTIVADDNIATLNILLRPQHAKLPSSNPAVIDAGNSGWRLLFDDTTQETASWEFVLDDDYLAETLYADVYFSMASGEANEVQFEGYVMAYTPGTDTADWDTDSYDTVNEGTATTVAATAGRVYKQTITLTNNDSIAAGDIVRFKLSTDSDDGTADDAVGDREVRYVIIRN